jgi:hypothetical protein
LEGAEGRGGVPGRRTRRGIETSWWFEGVKLGAGGRTGAVRLRRA